MKQIYTYTILIFLILITNTAIFAQDNTQVGLPEGAIARLGKGGINIMRFSPDGTYLAVGTDVGVWLYEVPNAKETALFTGHTGHVNALAFSQDGNYLASGGFNNPIIQIWDIDTKKKHMTITLGQDQVEISALSYSGNSLISINCPDKYTIWNVNTGRKLFSTRFENFHDVYTFSNDGSRIVASDREVSIHMWDTTTSRKNLSFVRHFQGDKNEIFALSISPDNQIIANAGENTTIQLWDSRKDTELALLSDHTFWVTALAFSEDGKSFASGDAGKIIKLWDLATQKERVTITGHKNTINALTFAPVGTPIYGMCLASGSADGTIRLWNPNNGKELALFTTGHTEYIKAIAFSDDDSTLTSAAFNGTVDTWDLKTRQKLMVLADTQSDATKTVLFSNDAQYYVCQGSRGMIWFKSDGFGIYSSLGAANNIQFWNLHKNEKLSLPWNINTQTLSTMSFSPHNNIIAISKNKEILTRHFITGSELFKLKGTQSLRSDKLLFSPDGQKLAAIYASGYPQVWEITTQRDITPPNIKMSKTIAFSPDSSTLAAASKEGIYLWRLDNKHEKKHSYFPGKLEGFNQELAFSTDGSILIGSGIDIWTTTIKLWDVDTGTYLGDLTGHTEIIESLVFSHDGKTLASCSQDGTVLLWNWNQISTKYMEEYLSDEVTNNLITVPDPIEYDVKAEEAAAVLDWLNKEGYQIEQLNKGYRVSHNGSTSSISDGGGTMRVGDVNVTVDRKGVLNIRTEIGSANFIFDKDGKLIFNDDE